MGIRVLKPYIELKPKEKFRLGGFTIYSFPVPHDGTNCVGYLIFHNDIDCLMYLTDLEYCPFQFKRYHVKHFLVEANYSMKFVDKDKPNYEHVLRGHQSVETCCNFLKANVSSDTENVILAHLSEFNSNDEYFISEAQKIAKNANIYIADKGLEVELHNELTCPFL